MLTFPINEHRKIVSFQILIIFVKTGFSVLKPNIFYDSIFNKGNTISLKNSWGPTTDKYFNLQWRAILCVNEFKQLLKYDYFNKCLSFGDF